MSSVDRDDARLVLFLQTRVNMQLEVILVDPVVQQIDIRGEDQCIATVQIDQPDWHFRRAQHGANLLFMLMGIVLMFGPVEQTDGTTIFDANLRFFLQRITLGKTFDDTCSKFHHIDGFKHVSLD